MNSFTPKKIQTNRNSFTSGFTLVETLVAVAVLMIAIVGPLSIASKGLAAAMYARNQMSASYLAQEAMEAVKNIRDNNIQTGNLWLTNLSTCVKGPSNPPCDVGAVDTSIAVCPVDGCQIYVETDGFGHTGTIPTAFKRYLYLYPVLGTSNEYTVTVSVSWKDASIPNQIDLSSQITRSTR